jgi:hypothetical protein
MLYSVYTCTAPIVGPVGELSSSVQLHNAVQCVCTALHVLLILLVGPVGELSSSVQLHNAVQCV